MINHHWTLILNEPGLTEVPADCTWARYVMPEFVCLALPSWLADVQRALVGERSYYDKTYRADELIRLLLQPKYEGLMAWPDARRIEPITGTINYPYGTYVAPNTPGSTNLWLKYQSPTLPVPIVREWRVDIQGVVAVRAVQPAGSFKEFAIEPELEIDLDSDIAIVIPTPTLGDSWTFKAILRPANVFSTIFSAVKRLRPEAVERLFWTTDAHENTAVLEVAKSLLDSKFDEDKLAGIAAAYVYNAEITRVGSD